jgi:hypothetical protein
LKIILKASDKIINRIEGHSTEFNECLREMDWDDEIKGVFTLTKKWKKGITLELIIEQKE